MPIIESCSRQVSRWNGGYCFRQILIELAWWPFWVLLLVLLLWYIDIWSFLQVIHHGKWRSLREAMHRACNRLEWWRFIIFNRTNLNWCMSLQATVVQAAQLGVPGYIQEVLSTKGDETNNTQKLRLKVKCPAVSFWPCSNRLQLLDGQPKQQPAVETMMGDSNRPTAVTVKFVHLYAPV